jgi:hypothetical protein
MLVSLYVADQQALFVMLGADGSINRLGTGAGGNTENDLCIGKTTPNVFTDLRGRINPDIFQWEGGHADPAPVGKSCKLTVGFQMAGGKALMSEWRYGSESLGPPPEVRDFVVAAVELTDPWYEQLKSAGRGG